MNNITTEISKPTILYVDDDVENLTSFKAVFRRMYDIFLASSAMEAIDILRTNQIQVMITDQRMPEMTGSELLAIVANDYPDTLRFMLTGFTDYNPLVDAINKGRLHGYFSKPFDPDSIRKKIESNLKSYYLEQENYQLLKRLQQSERFLDTIIQQIPSVICVKDANTLSFVRVNLAGEELFGYARNELIGKTAYDILTKEEADIVTQEDRYVLNSGEHLEIPEKQLYFSGKGLRWVNVQKIPICDDNGSSQFLLTVCRDITERKLMLEKEEALEKQILRLNKTQALGRLASGVAHDFNNMLSPIISYTQMLKMDIPEESELNLYADGIYTAALRSKELVHQILTFSRQAEQKLAPIKLAPVIKEALNLIKSSVPPNIKIVERIDKNAGFVVADITQIHQIIMNLATNACHAMEENGGILTVELKEVVRDTVPEDFICLKVSDTGIGIDQSIIDKVFDPYFTTKIGDKGTGLGLSVVQGIVKSYDGDIIINSSPGIGTEVVIYLPIHHS